MRLLDDERWACIMLHAVISLSRACAAGPHRARDAEGQVVRLRAGAHGVCHLPQQYLEDRQENGTVRTCKTRKTWRTSRGSGMLAVSASACDTRLPCR